MRPGCGLADREALQGNLDPLALSTTPAVVRHEVAKVLAEFGVGEGHIFNLRAWDHPRHDDRVIMQCIRLTASEAGEREQIVLDYDSSNGKGLEYCSEGHSKAIVSRMKWETESNVIAQRTGAYNPHNEHDSCGVGFVVDLPQP